MSDLHSSKDRAALLIDFRQLAAVSASLESLQNGIVKSISHHLANYNWTGFYMLDPGDPETLVLGPFVVPPRRTFESR